MLNGIFGKTEQEFVATYENVQNFIRIFYDQFYEQTAKRYNIRQHTAVIAYVLAKTNADLKHLPQPSIFKKSAQFTLNFVLNNPVITELPERCYLPEIPHRNFQNALLAFEICRRSLHKAIIHGTDGKTRILEVEIEPSQHQIGDIIKCLASVQPAEEAYDTYARLIALLYESLAYEFNPDCRYKPIPKKTT